MKTLSCEWCGQHSNDEYPVWGHKETVNSPYTVSHQTPNYCIMAALARAEAAEQRVAELAAATAWRPGDEDPPAPGRYQVAEMAAHPLDALGHADFDGVIWHGYPGNDRPAYWRFVSPLPPPPAPAPQEPTP